MSEREPKSDSPEDSSPLRAVRLSGRGIVFCLCAVALSVLGLFLVTGLAASPWLFLLYPLLIGTLIASLGLLALNLLHRF